MHFFYLIKNKFFKNNKYLEKIQFINQKFKDKSIK